MTTTTTTSPTTSARPVWTAAALSGVLAALATSSVAALGSQAGVSLDVDGEPIPIAGFVTMTVLAVVVGYILAIALNRWASRPRRIFILTTVVLTAASFIPDLTFPMETSTRALLITAHLVAASIVIPSVASRLNEHR